MSQNFYLKIIFMIKYCSIILKNIWSLEFWLPLSHLSTEMKEVWADMEEEMHLMMFTETEEDWGIFRGNFSKYRDSNGALVK